MSKQIPLPQGKFAIVDDEDFDLLMQWRWQYLGRGQGYAQRHEKISGNRKCIRMHRLIMNAPPNMCVDHINGNGLDNRKENLRICTLSQNQMNKVKCRGKSKYKGVSWRAENGKWVSKIYKDRKAIQLGMYGCEREAAIAYNNAAINIHGCFASLNIIL